MVDLDHLETLCAKWSLAGWQLQSANRVIAEHRAALAVVDAARKVHMMAQQADLFTSPVEREAIETKARDFAAAQELSAAKYRLWLRIKDRLGDLYGYPNLIRDPSLAAHVMQKGAPWYEVRSSYFPGTFAIEADVGALSINVRFEPDQVDNSAVKTAFDLLCALDVPTRLSVFKIDPDAGIFSHIVYY